MNWSHHLWAGGPGAESDERVRSGSYGNTSEYLRELVRRDQRLTAAARLRELILEGLESGEATPLTESSLQQLRDAALGSQL